MVEKDKDGPLISMDIKEFVMTIGARSPTPGGGSVAALTATMVGQLSVWLSLNLNIILHLCGCKKK